MLVLSWSERTSWSFSHTLCSFPAHGLGLETGGGGTDGNELLPRGMFWKAEGLLKGKGQRNQYFTAQPKAQAQYFSVAKQQHQAETLPGRAMAAGGDGDCPSGGKARRGGDPSDELSLS